MRRDPKAKQGNGTKTITVNDVGPINRFEFKLTHGINVLRGKNSAGKTTVLQATEALTTGRGSKDLEHRDGATLGEVQGLGARLTIGKRPTRTGELEVTSLEGRFSVLDIVEPGLVDPVAADKKRIKALVQLALGQQGADPSLFYQIFGGQEQFDIIVSSKTKETDDIVLMAARIKADAEDKARKLEDDAQKQIGYAQSSRNAAIGIDLEGPDDEVKLAEDYRLAIVEETRLRTERQAFDDAQRKANDARRALSTVEANRGANELLEAENKFTAEQATNERLAGVVKDLEEQLRVAKAELASSNIRLEAAENAVAAVKQHEETLSQWRAAIEAGNVTTTITDADLEQAAEDVRLAQEDMQQGAVIREAKKRVAEAEQHMTRAKELRDEADRLREAGRATDDVLSELVGRLGAPFTVSHGRLMADVGKGAEVFQRLGRGDQWTLVIKDIAAPALGKDGILVIKQEGFEGMDLEHRDLVHAAAIEKDLYILTAAWSMDTEIKAEVYEPTGDR